VTGRKILRIEFSGSRIRKICYLKDKNTNTYKKSDRCVSAYRIFPAQFWAAPKNRLGLAVENIHLELQEQLKKLRKEKKLLEARRLEQKTNYDLEMLKENGWCHGIENYSRHLEFRKPGDPPFTLLDYFNYSGCSDYIIFIDESHIALPQIRAMALQDQARKKVLIEHGFRLPSAIDNRPLTFKEFEEKAGQTVYVSATPAEFEKKAAGRKYIIEQLIRPTGLLEPSIEVRPAENQVENLIQEIKNRVAKKQRTLVLALTKRLAEALSDYLEERNIKACWLHAETKTLERPKILQDLRERKYDVLVGINLLREGLDLPEVSLVAILDADKEGFLRNETTLIQIMGRAARHIEGKIILYADNPTKSIEASIKEVERRRKIQQEYNKKHKIVPTPVSKKARKWPFFDSREKISPEFWAVRDAELLEKEMKKAAQNLDFERAAQLRDLLKEVKAGK
jgi:excinuclease ABC subunit B